MWVLPSYSINLFGLTTINAKAIDLKPNALELLLTEYQSLPIFEAIFPHVGD